MLFLYSFMEVEVDTETGQVTLLQALKQKAAAAAGQPSPAEAR